MIVWRSMRQYARMGFENLVNKKLADQQDAASTQAQRETLLAAARTTFNQAITATGRAAVQALTDHGVAPRPTGRVQKGMFQRSDVVQTGVAWLFPDWMALSLLRDGRWCVLSLLLSPSNLEYHKWVRKGGSRPILEDTTQVWLTGEMLTYFDRETGEACGRLPLFLYDLTINAWLADGVPMVSTGPGRKSAVPFDEWVAEGVAQLLRG